MRPRRDRLKRVRNIVGAVVLLGCFVQDVRPGTSQVSEILGLSQRGPGAQMRARLQRAAILLGEGRAEEVKAAADELLEELRLRRGQGDEHLDARTVDVVARRAVALRNAAVAVLFPAEDDAHDGFVTQVADAATFLDWATGVPASLTIAQAILESDWGRRAPGFNLFGIKGQGPAGSTLHKVVEWSGGERHTRLAAFRAYQSLEQSLADHAEVLVEKRSYARARAAGEDAEGWARALQGVYATDPGYAGKLARLMDLFDLHRFDWSTGAPVDYSQDASSTSPARSSAVSER